MSWAAYAFIAFVVFESLRTVRVVPPQVPQAVGETILLFFVLLLVLSLTTTIWGPLVRLSAFLIWLDHYQDQRRLAPLWCALYPVNPGQALQSDAGTLGALITVHDLRFRVARQVVELRDWYLGLLPYHAADALRAADALCRRDGIPEADLPCAVEAICLLAALQRRAAGCWASEPARWPTLDLLNRADTGLPEEIAVLIRVAHYYRRYRRSPQVRALLSQLHNTYLHDLAQQAPAPGVV